MVRIPQGTRDEDARIEETRAAYREACTLLGYAKASREADEVIDLLGVTEDGRRGARLAPFYPNELTAAVDRAAHLARMYPEALIDQNHRALLDLLLVEVVP